MVSPGTLPGENPLVESVNVETGVHSAHIRRTSTFTQMQQSRLRRDRSYLPMQRYVTFHLSQGQFTRPRPIPVWLRPTGGTRAAH